MITELRFSWYRHCRKWLGVMSFVQDIYNATYPLPHPFGNWKMIVLPVDRADDWLTEPLNACRHHLTGFFPGHKRVVSEGLSDMAVRLPTIMADSSDRHLCTSLSVSSWDIFTGCCPPPLSLPSADCAHLRRHRASALPWKVKNECSDLALFSNTASRPLPWGPKPVYPLPLGEMDPRSNYNPVYPVRWSGWYREAFYQSDYKARGNIQCRR